MLFKDLKPGYPVYVLLQSDEKMEAMQVKAVQVSDPYFPQPGSISQGTNMPTMQRVVDVSVEIEGKTSTYSIPETLSVTYAKGIVLSTDRDGILRDVEAIKAQKTEEIASVEKNRKILESCNHILEQWNPAYAERREQDKKIQGLESKMSNIEGMLQKIMTHFNANNHA